MFIEHQAELRSRSSFRSEIDSAFAHEWAHQPNGLDGFYKHGIPTGFWRRDLPVLLLFTLLIFCAACSQTTRSSGIPAGAQTAIDASIEDIDAGRYEKLYQEAADEWRQSATLEESEATLKTLHEKLGNARVRDFQTAGEEQTSTAPVAGHSLTVIYQTSFQRGQGMETFTLVEHAGRWSLARYFVSSTALK